MTYVDLSNTQLNGTIPLSIQNATNLEYLLLAENEIVGSLSTLALPALKVLDLSYNVFECELTDAFTKSIPNVEKIVSILP